MNFLLSHLTKKTNQESGIIFVTVLMMILIMAVLTINIISLNTSQAVISETETKRIQAEALAQGGLARAFMNQLSSSPSSNLTYNQTLDGTLFTISIIKGSAPTGPLGTYPLNISVTY